MGLHMKHYTSLINQTDWSAGAGVGVLSLSSDWKVRMTRNVALSKKLCLQIMTTLNSDKSYLLCQTISATANGQIAIRYYVCDLSCHRKSYVRNTIARQCQARCAANHHATLRCVAAHMSVHSLMYSCVVKVTKYLFILALCLLFGYR